MTALAATTGPQAVQQLTSLLPLKILPSKGSAALVEEARTDLRTRDALVAEAKLVVATAVPASLADIAVQLHRLGLHYPERRLSEREAQLVAEDWIKDLKGIPIDLIATAFDRWRTGPKCQFFPKSGEVLAIIDADRRYREQLAKRAAHILDALTPRGTA